MPPGFEHPVDREGAEIPGGHRRQLARIRNEQRSAFQIYEDVSEGTPVSPVFGTEAQLWDWLRGQGYSDRAVENFIILGASASALTEDGRVVDGIEACGRMTTEQAQAIAQAIRHKG